MKAAYVSPYTETLGQALEAAREELKNHDATVADESWLEVFTFDGIPYETKKEAHGELTTFRGKPTRKWAHLTIYRMDSGRYEWTLYFL